MARERDSSTYRLVKGFARIIDQQRETLDRIYDSHWIDYARAIDLDLLVALLGIPRKDSESDEEFRARVKQTFADPKRGGTVEAVKTQLANFLGCSKEDFLLIENPAIEMQVVKKVVSGESWIMSSSSIRDEKATIIISLENGEASDPTLIDLDAKIAIGYKGKLKKGDKLEIRESKAKLNGIDVTNSISVAATSVDSPRISRRPSKWIFKERITDIIGRFDQSNFDETVFYESVPPTTIRLAWTARLLGCFEIKIPLNILSQSKLTKQKVEAFVNAIKAAGIRTIVTVIDETDQSKKPASEGTDLSRSIDAERKRSK